MKRKELEDLGLTKEQADAVIKINGADIENAKEVASAEVEPLNDEIKKLQNQIKDRDKQLEDLKKAAGDNEDLQKQIETLQSDNAAAKKAHDAEVQQLRLDFATEKTLAQAKARNITAVKALLDLEDAKFDKDGNVKGLSEQIEKLQKADDTKFLFNLEEQSQQTQQQFKGFQPGQSTDATPQGGEVDFSKMSYDEIVAYTESNPNS